jgi:hexokinase
MNPLKQKTSRFLESHGLHPESVDLDRELRTFIREMEEGLSGHTSLKMITTYVSPDGEIPVGRPVIAIDAGGTNFRVALVTFDEKRSPVIEDLKVYPMPGTQGELDCDAFYRTMASYVLPLADRSDHIGFCFSFPVEMQPDKDGRLIQFNKEVRVTGAVGQLVGENLRKALADLGTKGEKSVVILNDTVATLLGGKAAFPDRRFDGTIGYILGTGTNSAYAEDNARIVKAPTLRGKPGTTLVNMESGGYAGYPQSPIDKALDATLSDPGVHTFEKMISGAYQGGLLLHTIAAAAKDGLFSPKAARAFAALPSLSSREIDLFCFYPFDPRNVLAGCVGGGNSVEEAADRQVLYHLVDALFERAARLVAVNLAAAIVHIGRGTDPCLPVCISAEGTTFYKSKLFRGKLDHYVKTFLNDRLGIYCDFVQADKSTLIGTAIAGLIG